MFHEVDREPIEQLGMCGVFPLRTKVGRRAHEACTKEHLPDPVDGYARGEWMLAHRGPLRKAESVGRRAAGRRGQNGGRCGVDFFSWLRIVAAAQDVRVARLLGERSEEHTSELQSPCDLVCRLLLATKKHQR